MARYDSYILRTWRSTGSHGTQWSGHLEHVQGGEELRFSDARLLLSHLQALLVGATVPRPMTDDATSTTWSAGARDALPLAQHETEHETEHATR